ncbi:MAG: type II secretion system F family protein [Firmicutes bacterium]|nr:type II secretion system F family protein [Bacillota bacterium]
MNANEMGSFFENMGMMIKAGITPSEAVGLLLEESKESGHPHTAYESMSQNMSMGSSLANAMKDSNAFPQYAVDMVDASEYTGKLEGTLFHLSDYYRTEHSMKNTFVSAVRYPIILLFMVIAVLIAMLAIVFPAFYGVYNNLTGSLVASSLNYINISFTLCKVLMVIMIILVILLLIGIFMWRGGKAATVRNFLSKISTFRQLFDNLDLYRFTSCFDMFISSGEMQDEAVAKSLPVAETEGLKSKLNRCIEKMQTGLSFSQAASEEKLYDPINNRMLIPAERSGMLDSILQKILTNLKDNNEAYVARIANTVEPFLTGFLMITLGLMLISLMVPLIGIMSSIG